MFSARRDKRGWGGPECEEDLRRIPALAKMKGREGGKTVQLHKWSTKQASLGAADLELIGRRETQNNKRNAKEVLPGGRKA